MEENILNQSENAMNEMINWLSDKNELGRKPSKIECTKKFIYNKMVYYIFKFKIGLFDNWLFGVCGGYEPDELTHCGHLYSNYQAYNQATEIDDAIKIIEYIMAYWQKRAEELTKE